MSESKLNEYDKRASCSIKGCEPSKIEPSPLHPIWRRFIRYCVELQHGEIETLKIQDGRPMLAEVVKKKVKFAREAAQALPNWKLKLHLHKAGGILKLLQTE